MARPSNIFRSLFGNYRKQIAKYVYSRPKKQRKGSLTTAKEFFPAVFKKF